MDSEQDPRKHAGGQEGERHPLEVDEESLAPPEQQFDDFLSDFKDDGFGANGAGPSTPSLDAPPPSQARRLTDPDAGRRRLTDPDAGRRRLTDPERRARPPSEPGRVRRPTDPPRTARRPTDPKLGHRRAALEAEAEPRIELDPSRDAALLAALQDVEALTNPAEEAEPVPSPRPPRITAPPGPRRMGVRSPADPEIKQRSAEIARMRDLERRLGEASAESDGLRRKLKSMAEDTSRYQKRLEGQAGEAREVGREDVFRVLVTLIDNLEAALQTSEEGQDFDRLNEGLTLVMRQFRSDFKGLGLRPFDSDGEPFDPTHHEAFAAMQTGAAEPGTVVKTVRRGYFFGDKLLRPALVMVEGSSDD